MAGAHSNVLFAMHFLPEFSPDEIAAEHRAWNEMHAKPLCGRDANPLNRRIPTRNLSG